MPEMLLYVDNSPEIGIYIYTIDNTLKEIYI